MKQIVIACNTLTMLGVDSLRGAHEFSVVGMSKGEELLLQASKKKKIGVIATQFTIGTEAHKRALLAADPTAEVYPLACPRFVPLIEGEQFDSVELQDAIAEYAAPLKQAGIDALLLGCTHFPFIREQLEAELGREKYKRRYKRVLRSTVYTGLTVSIPYPSSDFPPIRAYG